jgi:ABC-type transporter Mla subunit MlaD
MRDDNVDEPGAADEPPDPTVRPAAPDTHGDPAAATEDLRATGDSIRADVRRLASVEEVKRGLDAEDPQVDRLSDEAVGLADRIARQARAERQLSDEIG